MQILLSKTISNRWQATSPDDSGVHVIADSPNEVVDKALKQKADLDEFRALRNKQQAKRQPPTQ